MSLWQRIFQGLAAFSADVIVSNLASVLSAILVFRMLDVPIYGQLTLALSFFSAATLFLDFGLSGVFTAEVARARGGGSPGWAKFLLVRYLWLNLIMGSILLLVFLGIGYLLDDPLWAVIGVYLLTAALYGTGKVLFHSHTRYRRLAAQSVTRSISRLLLLAAMPLWWQGEALLGVAWTYPLMNVTALLTSAFLARRALDDMRDVQTTEFSMASLTALFRQQGVYAVLTIPVKKVADQLPIWFLQALTGDEGVGLYGAARKGYSFFSAAFATLETTIFPLVSEQIEVDKERLQLALRQMQKYTFWLGLAGAVIGGLAAHWLVLIITGKEYLMAVPVFRLMLWHLVIYAFLQSQRPLFYALGQQKWLFILFVISTVVYGLLLWGGISTWSVKGAVWAALINSTLFAFVRMFVLGRIDPQMLIDPRHVFRLEEFDRRLWQVFKGRVEKWRS